MTRVLSVYRTYFPDPPGGIQECIRNLGLSTQAHGVETRVFALSPSLEPRVIDRPEGRIIRSRSWAAPASCDLGGLDAFSSFVEQARWADVVHLHFPWPFVDLLRMALPRGKPCLLTYHSDIVRQRLLGALYAPLMRHTLRSVDRIVVTSPNYAASSQVLRQVPADKLQIIPMGLEDHSLVANSSDILHRLSLSKGGYFLGLGVLRYYKGFHTLIQAASSVPCPIVIAGSGGEEKRLKALAKELNASNVIFTGQVSDEEKFALLSGCRAFAFPSHLRSEAFGLSLVEAAMMGKPMVSCEIGTGTSFVNLHGETGFVIPPEAPAALADALNHLRTDESLALRLGQASRARYERLFSAASMGDAYAALYHEL